MNQYKAIVFDLDDTLYSEKLYFLDVFGRNGETRSHLKEITDLFDSGIRQKSKDVFRDVLNELGIFSVELHNDLFDLYVSCDSDISLDEDSIGALEWVKAKGLISATLTNGVVRAQKNKVRCLGLSGYLDYLFYARELTCAKEKPAAEAFLEICGKMDVAPEQCVFIGDHPRNDVEGPLSVGMHSIQVAKYNELHAAAPAVDRYRTLLESLEGLEL